MPCPLRIPLCSSCLCVHSGLSRADTTAPSCQRGVPPEIANLRVGEWPGSRGWGGGVTMTGAEWMVRTLRERGVEVVFLLCGNGLKPFLDACVEGGMPVVDTRNEQAAAYMAD